MSNEVTILGRETDGAPSPEVESKPPIWLSLVIPTRRIGAALRQRIARSLSRLPDTEIIVVEPHREDEGETETATEGVRLVRSDPGRGPQCNAGARMARGEVVLFLHDDTELPAYAAAVLRGAFARPEVGAACFRLRFDHPSRVLALYGWFSRFDSVLTTFGDQGLAVRRSLLDAVGGFPDWPLLEDVELARRLRRRTRILKLPATVVTSAERYRRNGVIRQQIRNGWILVRFLVGASPEGLAAEYERTRARPDKNC